jgi:PIN domain nuclease of toxin-antitoxin system
MNGYLFDTHVWLWLQRGDTQDISPGFLAELDKHQQDEQLYISAISILEIARLVSSGQYDLGTSVEEFLATATVDGGLRLLDLTPQIFIESTRLPADIHRDPADRLLVATARTHDLTLITRDKNLLRYAKEGHLNAHKL